MQNNTRKLVINAMFVCLLIIGAQISIPLPGMVPISLQTLAIYVLALMFDAKTSFVVTVIYLVMGVIGLPVFAGFTGGASHLVGPAGGFLFGFPIMAVLISIIASKSNSVTAWIVALVLGTVILYTIGTVYFMYVAKAPLTSALMSCVIPFIPGDFMKMAGAVLVTKKIKKFVVQKENILLNS